MAISDEERNIHNSRHDSVPAEDAYYVSLQRRHAQAGIPAKILGIRLVTPRGLPPRPSFHVEYPDGRRDYVAMEDSDYPNTVGRGTFYRIISKTDVDLGLIPPTLP